MNEFSLDILLDFLYNKFAFAFIFCFFGSFIKEYLTGKNKKDDKKNYKFNMAQVVISAIFAAFLLCGIADYVNIDFHIEIYAIVAIVLGMWGMDIIKLFLDVNFIHKLITVIAKNITSPIIKGMVESEDSDKKETNNDTKENDKANDTKENDKKE